jgi:alpha-tubulin suppressor-like RCC1 family protein
MEVLGLRGVVEVAGSEGRCALLQNGHVFCWGPSAVGQLGNGDLSADPECNGGACSATPVEVQGIDNATEVAGAWDGHFCAVLATGEVKCWGDNSKGQLGVDPSMGPEECAEGAAMCSSVPIVVPGIANALEVRVGSSVSCALLADGKVKCWGQSVVSNGVYSPTPVGIEGVQEAVHFAKVSPEVGEFLCVVRSSGGLSCWGDNREGDLGNGHWSAGPNPSDVSGLESVVEVALSAEGELACARLESGEVDCWGNDYHGELGNGTGGEVGEEGLRFSAVPVKVLGIDDAVGISVGGGPHRAWACAVLADETEKCWGENLYGQLGNGRGGYKNYPPAEDESLVVESSNRPVFVRRPE